MTRSANTFYKKIRPAKSVSHKSDCLLLVKYNQSKERIEKNTNILQNSKQALIYGLNITLVLTCKRYIDNISMYWVFTTLLILFQFVVQILLILKCILYYLLS